MRDLAKDSVTLIKKADGSRRSGIKAVVQPSQIITFETSIDFASGDHLERVLPSGRPEFYEILDPGFQQGLDTIPAAYVMSVRKVPVIPRVSPVAPINIDPLDG